MTLSCDYRWGDHWLVIDVNCALIKSQLLARKPDKPLAINCGMSACTPIHHKIPSSRRDDFVGYQAVARLNRRRHAPGWNHESLNDERPDNAQHQCKLNDDYCDIRPKWSKCARERETKNTPQQKEDHAKLCD